MHDDKSLAINACTSSQLPNSVKLILFKYSFNDFDSTINGELAGIPKRAIATCEIPCAFNQDSSKACHQSTPTASLSSCQPITSRPMLRSIGYKVSGLYSVG